MDHSYTRLSIRILEEKNLCVQQSVLYGIVHLHIGDQYVPKWWWKINSESQSCPCFMFAITEPLCVANTLYQLSRNRAQEGKRGITSVSKYFMALLNFNLMLTMCICLYAPFDCAGLWGCSLLLYLAEAHYPHPCSKLLSARLLLAGANTVVVEEEKLELHFQVASLVLPSSLRCQWGCGMGICVH